MPPNGCNVITPFHQRFLGRDLIIRPCCDEHDLFYEQGGSWRNRAFADKILRCCVRDMGYPVRAWIIWTSVRLFGWTCWGRK